MALTSQQIGLLGLNTREVRVFLAIAAFGPLGITKIAARSGVNRTSVDYIVRGLVARELVIKVTFGKRFHYVVALEQIAQRLESLEKFVDPQGLVDHGNEETLMQSQFSVEDLTTKFDVYLESHVGERFTALLCQSSAERLPWLLKVLCKTVREKRQKADILMPRVHVKLLTSPQEGEVAEHHSDFSHVTVLPSGFVSDTPNIVAFHNHVLFVDLNKNILTECVERQQVEVYKYFLHITKQMGWEIDFSSQH